MFRKIEFNLTNKTLFMKNLLTILLLSWIPILCSAQKKPYKTENSNPNSSFKTIEKRTAEPEQHNFSSLEKNKIQHRAALKEKQSKQNSIYIQYIGTLPGSSDYDSKKQNLINSNPAKYNEMKEDMNRLEGNKANKKRLSIEKYNSLSPEQQKEINNNPHLYEITK